MYRGHAAAALLLGIFLIAVPISVAYAAGTQADKDCPAESKPKSVYASQGKPPTYQEKVGNQTITVTNLSWTICRDTTCPTGVVTGFCRAFNDCHAEKTCAGEAPKLPTDAQLKAATLQPPTTPSSPQNPTSLPSFVAPGQSMLQALQNPQTNIGQESIAPSATNFNDLIRSNLPSEVVSGTGVAGSGGSTFSPTPSGGADAVQLQGGAMPGATPVNTISEPGATPLQNYPTTQTFGTTPTDANGQPLTNQQLVDQAKTPQSDCNWWCSSVSWAKDTATNVGDYLFGGPEGSNQVGLLSPTQTDASPNADMIQKAANGEAISGTATEYNPFKPGESSGGKGLATGGTYDPNAYTAAIQTDIGRATGCGVGGGTICYARVDYGDKSLVVALPDNGPLSGNGIPQNPTRIIDLNQASMDYLSGVTNSSNVSLNGVKVTLLPGTDYMPGPVTNTLANTGGGIGGEILAPLNNPPAFATSPFTYGPGEASAFNNLPSPYAYGPGEASAFNNLPSPYTYGPGEASAFNNLAEPITPSPTVAVTSEPLPSVTTADMQTMTPDQIKAVEQQQLAARIAEIPAPAPTQSLGQQLSNWWTNVWSPPAAPAPTPEVAANNTPASSGSDLVFNNTVSPGAQNGFTPGSVSAAPETTSVFTPNSPLASASFTESPFLNPYLSPGGLSGGTPGNSSDIFAGPSGSASPFITTPPFSTGGGIGGEINAPLTYSGGGVGGEINAPLTNSGGGIGGEINAPLTTSQPSFTDRLSGYWNNLNNFMRDTVGGEGVPVTPPVTPSLPGNTPDILAANPANDNRLQTAPENIPLPQARPDIPATGGGIGGEINAPLTTSQPSLTERVSNWWSNLIGPKSENVGPAFNEAFGSVPGQTSPIVNPPLPTERPSSEIPLTNTVGGIGREINAPLTNSGGGIGGEINAPLRNSGGGIGGEINAPLTAHQPTLGERLNSWWNGLGGGSAAPAPATLPGNTPDILAANPANDNRLQPAPENVPLPQARPDIPVTGGGIGGEINAPLTYSGGGIGGEINAPLTNSGGGIGGEINAPLTTSQPSLGERLSSVWSSLTGGATLGSEGPYIGTPATPLSGNTPDILSANPATDNRLQQSLSIPLTNSGGGIGSDYAASQQQQQTAQQFSWSSPSTWGSLFKGTGATLGNEGPLIGTPATQLPGNTPDIQAANITSDNRLEPAAPSTPTTDISAKQTPAAATETLTPSETLQKSLGSALNIVSKANANGGTLTQTDFNTLLRLGGRIQVAGNQIPNNPAAAELQQLNTVMGYVGTSYEKAVSAFAQGGSFLQSKIQNAITTFRNGR